MIGTEPQWSCFVVSDDNKKKASYLNAVITNKISGTQEGTKHSSVILSFNDNTKHLSDSDYRTLDSVFDFGFEFALTCKSKERSTVLQQALLSIPDARLLLVRQNNDGTCIAFSMEGLEIKKAVTPQECDVSYVATTETNFATLDHFGEFLNTIH